MAYTANTALTEVRTLINEPSAYFWTDAQIALFIQQGCLDWTEKTLTNVKEDTITVLTNTVKYTTSGSSYIDDAIMCLHAEYSNKAMQRVSYEQIRGHNAGALASDPAPKYYYDQYNANTYTLYIGPTPSVTYNSTTMTVLFACRTDDITEIPYEYQMPIIMFAAHKCRLVDRQFQDAMAFYNIYMESVKFARRDSLEPEPQLTEEFRIK